MKNPRLVLAAVFLTALAMLGGLKCVRYAMRRAEPDDPLPPRYAPVTSLASAPLKLSPVQNDRRRILLDARAIARLRESARLGTQPFRTVVERTEEAMKEPARSGYQAFDWADALANATLLWHATGDERYARTALVYLRAILDDRYTIGDKKGGTDVVTHDSGYGIRTFGAYSALGYDWLRGAPGMDDALRAHVLERLEEWLSWYAEKGYLRNRPTANYYWGYLTTLAFAGLAASGESPAGDRWLEMARNELATAVLPTFREELPGGGWPEGWQYGEYTTMEVAFVAEAFRTGAGVDVTSKLPWLGQTVTHHVHALLPDEKTVYDGGSWGEHPARPSALAMAAASIALEGVNDQRAAEARWLVTNALPPLRREQAWVGLLADRPNGEKRQPRVATTTSLYMSGMGLTFVRSDWSKTATWASFQAGPPRAEDHQDADQGHFELARGADILLVDGGSYEGSATINHNTLLIDDGGRHNNYPPNQGVWGKKVKTSRFGDDGVVAVAVGDIGEAYAPSCIRQDCSDRSVEGLERTFVFVRPSVLVIRDTVELEQPDFAVHWAAHATRAPTVNGEVTSVVIGASRADVRSLLPDDAKPVVLREPTPSGEGSHRANSPWGPMWRIEVPSPKDSDHREFLHFISVGPAEAAPPPTELLRGKGLLGGAGVVDGRRVVVLFADATEAERSLALGRAADTLVVVGLAPGKHYRSSVDANGGCTLRLAESANASDGRATSGGFLRINASRCKK